MGNSDEQGINSLIEIYGIFDMAFKAMTSDAANDAGLAIFMQNSFQNGMFLWRKYYLFG